MKSERLMRALGAVNDRFVEEAMEEGERRCRKKKRCKRAEALLAVLAAAVLAWLYLGVPRVPFKGVTAEELRAVEIEFVPPRQTVTLTAAEREELAGLLGQVRLYRRSLGAPAGGGRGEYIRITFRDGNCTMYVPCGSGAWWDGTEYKALAGPNLALETFADEVFNQRDMEENQTK